jgi:hypothetical protein
MSSPKPTQGLRTTVRSPNSIVNEQNHDDTASQRSANGVPASIDQIISPSTAKTAITDNQMLIVSNTSASWNYVFVGKDSDCPLGAPDITNGIGVPPNSQTLFICGKSDDPNESIVVKASNATVQIVVVKN